MPRKSAAYLTDLGARVFAAVDATPAVALRVSRGLVRANLYGIDSHGVVRIADYVMMAKRGIIVPAAAPAVVKESPVIAVVDGNWAFGQITADRAMAAAIQKASSIGVGIGSTVRAAHVGAIGEYTEQAAGQGLVGLAFVNGIGKFVAPFGGRARQLSTNPISLAVPVPGGRPVLVDFASSVVAEGKLRVARNKGAKIPAGLVIDQGGESADDPNAFYAGGALLPLGGLMAGHKGYGLSIMCEVLAGMLSGSGVAALEPQKGNGCCFVALDPGAFRPREAFLDDVRRFVETLRATPPMPGVAQVLVPGDPEARAEQERLRDGIALDDVTWHGIVDAAKSVGVEA